MVQKRQVQRFGGRYHSLAATSPRGGGWCPSGKISLGHPQTASLIADELCIVIAHPESRCRIVGVVPLAQPRHQFGEAGQERNQASAFPAVRVFALEITGRDGA